VQDDQGAVHVALRGGGAVVTLTPGPWRIAARRPVCVAPRGIAFDPRTQLLHVACAEGSLVSLPAAPEGAPVRRLTLDGDLRDVVVDGANLLVSRFRSAEVLTVDGEGRVTARATPATRSILRQITSADGMSVMQLPGTMTASVAWRMVPFRPGQALVLHQRAMAEEVPVDQPGGYGGVCGGIVESTVSAVGPLGQKNVPSPAVMGAVVAVDVAVSPDGREMAVVAPGTQLTASPFGDGQSRQVVVSPTDGIFADSGQCTGVVGRPPPSVQPPSPGVPAPDGGTDLPGPVDARAAAGQVTAVTYDKRGHLLVQTRDPASIQVLTANRQVVLSDDRRSDVGLDIFHTSSAAGLACASCHPEGGDDGRVWKFADKNGKVEARRTQNLRGGIMATAPFHWNGDLKSLGSLMDEVFVRRMRGPSLSPEYVDVLGRWLDTVPAMPKLPARDPAAAARGRDLFQSAQVGCASCHNGPLLTNNTTVDVGTGRPLQVPALRGVGWRTPLMHDGCAGTVAQRFDPTCGGGADRHGVTSRLTAAQLADLAAFVETL
jgi:YD repeat-containing protein